MKTDIMALIVFFMMGFNLCIPVIQKQFEIDAMTVKADTLGDDPPELPGENWWIYPELQPRQIFVAPIFNWSKFWNVFKNHAFWSLEGWNPQTEEWEFANDSLTIEITTVGDNGRKLNLVFDAPAPITTDYRLTLAIDYRVKQYVYKVDKYTYNLIFEAYDERFNVSYNFSDIANIPGIIITHGVKEIDEHDYFWFRARHNDVSSGYHVELDPTYTVSTGPIYIGPPHQRRLVRQSNGTLWCGYSVDNTVHVAWSENSGATWTDYTVCDATGYSLNPSLAVDSNDVVHFTFHSNKNDADDYNLEYTNSSDWTTIVQIRDEDKIHTYPAIAIDSNDNLHVIYQKGEEGTSNDDQVAYISSMDNGGTWGTEKILTDEVTSADDSWFPSIAIDSNDVIHVVFQAEDHYNEKDDILHIQSSDYGDTWTHWENDPIYQDATYNQRKPCIAIDDNDVLHVVWYAYSQNVNDQVGYSHNDSSGWSVVEWVTWDATVDYVNPSVSVNDNDYIHTTYRVVATKLNHSVNDTSSWTADIALSGNYDYPNMISAQWPVIGGLKTNRPKTGYALITSSGSSNVTYHASDDLTWDSGIENNAPTLAGEIPANTSTGISLTPVCNVTANDDDGGDTLTVTFYENTTGAWVLQQTNGSVSPGTSVEWDNYNNASASNTKYWWSVNLTDSTDWCNETYHFTTEAEPPPEITSPYPSNGSVDIELNPILNITIFDGESNLMNITWYSNSSDVWEIFEIGGVYAQANYSYGFEEVTELEDWTTTGIRYSSDTYAHTGTYSLEIEGISEYGCHNLFLANYSIVNISWWVYPDSMETDEYLYLRFYNGASWTTIRTVEGWQDGIEDTHTHYYDELDTNSYIFNDDCKICWNVSASGIQDRYYLDDINIAHGHLGNMSNGVYTTINSNFSDYGSTYYWNVSVNDGTNTNDSDIFHFTTLIDPTPPTITINFAGNLGDSGGPYWQPPGESTQLTGTWSDGYYTNDSHQSEGWIYINLTVSDTDGIDKVWLQWLNETIWTNYTYDFLNTTGGYFEINTSGNISTAEGYNYSFNIVANDTEGNSNMTWWNKTGVDGSYTRRYVQLNCTVENISYFPLYSYGATYDVIAGTNRKDRLHHDQGYNGSNSDTGFIKSVEPTDTVENIYCDGWTGHYYEDSVSVESFTLKNIYYHFWWSGDNDNLAYVGWIKSREEPTADIPTDYYTANMDESHSSISYNGGTPNDIYYLDARLFEITPENFTDNDMYELMVVFNDGNNYPSIISNRSFTSFVLFNIPDNATLNASHADTDSDNLSDWNELYVTYTNPFLSDTDNDGINDYWENQAGSDPNNYTETFNVSKEWVTLDTWNITLSNMPQPYILDTWNITLSNTPEITTLDTWNLTLGNLTISPFTIDTWNLTLSNLTISSFTIDTWNITLSNTPQPYILDTWNLTLSNLTISPFTIDTWNITLSNTPQPYILDTWNLTLSNTSVGEILDRWNITLSNSSFFFITDVKATPSEAVIDDVTINITCNVTSLYAIVNVTVNMTEGHYDMANIGDLYYYIAINSTIGTHYYHIYANDTSGDQIESSTYSFKIIGLSCSFTYTVSGGLMTLTPTITGATHYQWTFISETGVKGQTPWIPIEDIGSYIQGYVYPTTIRACLSAKNINFNQYANYSDVIRIYKSSFEKPTPPEEIPEPEPTNIFKEIADAVGKWFGERNGGELLFMTVIAVIAALFVVRKKYPQKKFIYQILKKKKKKEKERTPHEILIERIDRLEENVFPKNK